MFFVLSADGMEGEAEISAIREEGEKTESSDGQEEPGIDNADDEKVLEQESANEDLPASEEATTVQEKGEQLEEIDLGAGGLDILPGDAEQSEEPGAASEADVAGGQNGVPTVETEISQDNSGEFVEKTAGPENEQATPENFGKISISEVMIGQTGAAKNEFIELYNAGQEDVSLEGWSLKKKTKSGNESNLLSSSKFTGTLKAGSYFVISHPSYLDIEKSDAVYSGTSYSIAADNSAILYDGEGNFAAALCWGACEHECLGILFGQNPSDGESIAWNGEEESYMITKNPTPGDENEFGDPDEEEKICGNSVLEQGEECDDGNNADGDGCSANCRFEQNENVDELLKNIVINEALPDPEGPDTEGEWIELYNNSEYELPLKDCYLIDENLKEKNDLQGYFYFDDQSIVPYGFLVLDYKETKISLNNTGDIIELYNRAGELLSGVSFGKSPFSGFSWARKEGSEYDWSPVPTPGNENFFPPKSEYSKLLIFSEVLPNPEGTDKNNEWLEILNLGEKEVELSGWVIENGAGKRFAIKDLRAEPGGRVQILVQNSSLAIRNSNERLKLLDPNWELVDEIIIEGSAKSGLSYSRNSAGRWGWSKYLTPGKENRLNKRPVAKIKKDKDVYEGVYAVFDASKSYDKDGEKLKFKWDFGDGRKSYLKKTRHKYEKKGEYKASLTVGDGVEETRLEFSVKVRNFPKYDIQIIGLLPNPQGNDRGNERIVLLSNEKKRINLKDYYILTGRNKKQSIRHMVYEEFFLYPGKAKEIINGEICKYSLYNKKGAVILSAPDGEWLDSVKYFKEKIGDGDYYFLNEQGDWEWLVSETQKEEIPEVLGIEIPFQRPAFDWTAITRNESRKCCETKKAQKISNWLFDNKQWIGLLSKLLGTNNFSLNS